MKASDSKKMQKRERVEIVHLPPSYTEPDKTDDKIGPDFVPNFVDGPVTISEGSRGRRARRQKQLDLTDQPDIG